MASVPQTIYKAVKPYVNCPDPIWECVVQYESNFNPVSVGDGPAYHGYSYGLFQLHVATNGTAQGNTALSLIQKRTGLTGQAAITYLLQHVDLQAEVGMPSINNAWAKLKDTFSPKDANWWTQFCSMSGHPGGSASDPTTQAYVNRFMQVIVGSNTFGIQQVTPGSTQSTNTTSDNTWLQALINMPPNQPCGVIWRRTCPNAKNANEGGMDLPSPNGTQVYSLGDGIVVGAGYFWHPDETYGAGVVTVRTAMPDGTTGDVYYQHIQISPNIILCNQTGGQLYHNVTGPPPQGQNIKKGQLLGTVIQGLVEVGVNAEWFGVWGTTHPGSWADDPEPIIRKLMVAGGGTSLTQLPITTGNSKFDAYLQTAFQQNHTAVQTLTQTPGIAGPIKAFQEAQQFKPFVVPDDNSTSANWPVWGGTEQAISYPARMMLGILNYMVNNTLAYFIRGIFVVLALVVIIALLINAVSHTTETVDGGDEGGNMLPGQQQGQGQNNIANAAKVASLAAL